jgi:hydroxymethylglutaryl-CoA synthase
VEFVRVRSVGAALPSLRLAAADVARAWGESGGHGQAAVCADDEDGLTLAWTAAERALAAARIDVDDIGALFWGTSHPPYAEGPSHAYLAAAVGLAPHTEGALCAGSSHAGMEALLAGWDAVAAGRARDVVVVASDDVLPGLGTAYERRAGAAAAAVVLSASGEGGAALDQRTTHSVPVLDRYRGSAEPYTRDTYDPRLFREQTFLPILSELGSALGAINNLTGWSLPDPDGRLGKALARKLGVDNLAADAYARAGDTGAAAPLLGIATALATPGEYGVLGYGGGRATGVTVNVERPVAGAAHVCLDGGRQASYAEVLRARKVLVGTGETVPMGVPPGSAAFVRGGREMLQLLGARCVECGTVNTPPSVHPRCVACGAGKLTDVVLAREGTVQTFATNYAMPEPFVAPLPLAVLDLDDGARLMVQVTDGPGVADTLAIGDRARLVLRRYAVERGAPVYGYKAERIDAEGSKS